MTAVSAAPTRDVLTSGKVILTVTLPETFVAARNLLGEGWHPEYRYRIERVENPNGGLPAIYIRTYTTNPRKPDSPGSYVYTGAVHPRTGAVTLTRSSAFPATATRFRVADKVLRALFGGRAADVAAAGWELNVEVLEENPDRF